MKVLLTFVGCFTTLAAVGIALYVADRAARKRAAPRGFEVKPITGENVLPEKRIDG